MKTIYQQLGLLFITLIIAASCSDEGSVSYTSDNKNGKADKKSKSSLCVFIDSASINDISNNHAGSSLRDCYHKFGDSLKWSNDTDTLHWLKEDTNTIFTKGKVTVKKDGKTIKRGKEYHANIWKMFPVKLSPELLNQPLCIGYEGNSAFEIFINGKLMLSKGHVSSSKEGEIIKAANGNFYTSFNKPDNYITLRASNHSNYNTDGADVDIFIGSDKTQHEINERESVSDKISTILSIFYFTFFFIYLNLFLSDRKAKTNLYFSLFCFFIFFVFFKAAIDNDVENYKVHLFLSTVDLIIIAPLNFTFVAFLHQLVFGRLKKYLLGVLAITILSPITLYFGLLYINVPSLIIGGTGLGIVILFSIINGVRVVYLGLKRKIAGSKTIIYGVFISLMIFIINSICLGFIDSVSEYMDATLGANANFILFSIPLIVIPISVSISLIKNYTETSQQLAEELINVSQLSEKTIQQEKEKQHILESQKEKLEEQVILRTAEIVRQKNLVEEQKQLIEEKQHEIIDSITYAKRLQQAILPSAAAVKEYLPDSFIYYQPKDIVAGDFYWMHTTKEAVYIAAADCTGHGVPGAMVSVVCSNALNRAVNEFNLTDTGLILDKTRELVIETFEKSDAEVKDGMDISLLRIQTIKGEHKEVQWSGANNSLWYVLNPDSSSGAENNQLIEIKADKQPIGKYSEAMPFSTNNFKFNVPLTIYLFSDGYADQFSPDDKKLMKKRFKDIVLSIQNLSMQEQKNYLDKFHNDWKGTMEQTDDLLVIGIQL